MRNRIIQRLFDEVIEGCRADTLVIGQDAKPETGGGTMTYAIHICDHRSEPGDTECWEVVWSGGRSCKRCYRECYRKGWDKARVMADNAERVRRRNEREANGERDTGIL